MFYSQVLVQPNGGIQRDMKNFIHYFGIVYYIVFRMTLQTRVVANLGCEEIRMESGKTYNS